MQLMKVVFLDIDGVLNGASYGEDTYFDAFADKDLALHQSCLDNLKAIVDAHPDAKIVWTSDWRFYDKAKWHQWKNPKLYLEALPWLAGKFIGKTPAKMSSEHYHDIKWWLDENKTEHYVILEDSYFPKNWFGIEKHLVATDSNIGLSKKDADLAIKILNGEFEK